MRTRISISSNHCEADQFVAWLNRNGYAAETNNTTGNYVNGVWTSTDPDARQLLTQLWGRYCSDC